MRYYIGIKKLSQEARIKCNEIIREGFRVEGSYQEYQELSRGRKPRLALDSEQSILEYFYNREWDYLYLELDKRVFPIKILSMEDFKIINKYISSLHQRNLDYPEHRDMLLALLELLARKDYSLIPIV